MSSQQRDLRINLSANAAGLEKGLDRAGRAMEKYQRSVEDANNAVARLERELQEDMDRTLAEVEENAARRAEAFQSAGRGMLVAGAAITAGLGMSAQAAISWESDWAGVTKVLDATPEELEKLESSLRDLALQIPLTHSELAAIAAAAGQLGVESQNILHFTKTIAAMGVATNMTVEEAAMSMARFSSIMGTPQENVDQLGSSLVALGNSSAATESEIMEMAMRIAGAGQTVGLTEGEVLGFAAALKSVGMEAESGGSAVSRVLLDINSAVGESGEKLQDFAQVSGMSAQEFSAAWEADPAKATHAFVDGLAEMNAEGENVVGTLDRLGFGEIIVRDALLRMAGASDLVGESLKVGNEGWEENLALVEEAAARYETTESQIQMAKNAITETGISIGESLLPILGEAAEKVTDYGGAFKSLDDGQKQWVTSIGGGVGALALLTGALITVGPRMIEFRGQMQELRTGGANRLQRGIGGLATMMTGPYGIAIGAVLGLGAMWLDQKAKQIAKEQEWAGVLAASEGAITASTAAHAAQRLEEEGLLGVASELGIEQGRLTEAVLENGEARQALTTISDHMAATQDGLVTLNTGEKATTEELTEAVQTLLGEKADLSEMDETQLEAIALLASQTSGLTDEMDAGAEAAAAVAGETEETVSAYVTASEAADQYRESVDRLNSSIAESISAELDYNSTLLRSVETVTQNAGATDKHTEAGIANHRAILDLIDAGDAEVQTMIANEASTEDLEKKKKDLREDLELLRDTVGLTDEQFAEYDEMLRNVESNVDTAVEVTAKGTWTQSSAPASGGEYLAYADGGSVIGPGTGTSDSIRALLSNGEHVLTAREVQMLGGQDSVYAMRDLIRRGDLKFARGGAVGEPRRFARGGAVLPDSATVVNDHDEDTRIKLQQMIEGLTASIAEDAAQQWKKHMESGGSVVSAWKSQLGVPYSWGGGGPGGPGYGFGRGAGIRGFDCSSLMQYGWNKAGVSLPRVTYAQINYGKAVPKGQERPGDLVFPHRGHVAGVAGPGRLIHAPYTGATVSYRGMYPNPIAIRRPGKYDQGGRLEHGEVGVNLSRRPERVLAPRDTANFERLVEVLSGTTVPAAGAGPTEVHYHVHHVPGFTTGRDLQRAEESRQTRVRTGRRG
ncbi:phage tail tape measure protein [Nocardiopsis ganjiahuensis]|uniref:phage tail tape measure protein n=1 Tax=Nocardiopsis ganjiahuensis TaxID=239984 RepID=UPI000344B98D|nr:phage tail tape measure protein [Nocardiopsis ganjiahuensis]